MASTAIPDRTFSQAASRIAEGFTTARLNGRALSTFPGTVPQNLAQAYEAQEAALARWPDAVAGWKVARIAPTWQTAFPSERIIGPAFRRNIHFTTAAHLPQCPVLAGGFAAVEAELVVVVAADAPAHQAEWTIDDVMPFIGSMHIGIEVASSPLATLNDLGPGAVIADFGNNWGIVVGAAIADWRDRVDIAVETFVDEVSVGMAKVNMVKGPLEAMAFTLSNAALRGRPLRAGDVITTGMITGVHDIAIGQHSRHVFDGCGEVGCEIVRASHYLGNP